MTLLNAIILLGLILITFGCVFYVIAMLMERYYDRKLWELNQRLRKDDKWRNKQQIETTPLWALSVVQYDADEIRDPRSEIIGARITRGEEMKPIDKTQDKWDDDKWDKFDLKLYSAIHEATGVQLNEDAEIFELYCNLRDAIFNEYQ